MEMWTTREAFRREVGALYDAKRRFLEAHEEMAAVASDPQLARCLRQHRAQIGQQIAHLDSIGQLLSEQETVVRATRPGDCPGMSTPSWTQRRPMSSVTG